MNDSYLLICSLITGLCVAGIAITNRENYSEFLDFVERDLYDRLRSMRAATKNLRRWINLWVAMVIAIFLTLWLAMDAFPPAIVCGALLSAGPWYLIRRWSNARRQKIEDQLADSMVGFSSAIRAGMSIAQAVEMLADENPRPICQEFRQIIGEYQMGKPLERTLTEAKERLKSENFVLFAAALLASRESGGKLNETVDRIAKSVLEVQRLERKVRAETAQARKSAVYMAIIPLILLIVYFFIDPVNTTLLFTTFIGQLMLSAAFLLNLIAYLWALKILNPDI